MYDVLEIFDSYQGEGILLGRKATFIRLANCNLTCPWCDTNMKAPSDEMTAKQIASQVNPNVDLVVITGGEPTLYDLELLAATFSNRIAVAIETNGTNPVPKNINWIACSPKREAKYMIHPDILGRVSEYKYVVDTDFNPKVIETTKARVWLQPEFYNFENSVKHIDQILMAKNVPDNWRIGIQAHRYWGLR
jgi:organic radical activating enzyme